MPCPIQSLGKKILFETPGVCALIYAGAAGYFSEGDPQVRQQLSNTKHQVKHWATVFHWAVVKMSVVVTVGAIAAVAAYFQTKEKMWLAGAAALFGTAPYTLLVMMKTNKKLLKTLKDSGDAQELNKEEKGSALNSMKKWVNLHRGRVLLSLASAALFFVAKEYSKTS